MRRNHLAESEGIDTVSSKCRLFLLCSLALLGLLGCTRPSAPVAKFPGGRVTRVELAAAWKIRQAGKEEPKSAEVRKKLQEDLARDIAVSKMILLRGRELEKSPEAQSALAAAGVKAAEEQWNADITNQAAEKITPQDLDNYIAKHVEDLTTPTRVAYYFIFLKTRGLDAQAVEAKQTKAREIVREAWAKPTEFPRLVVKFSEVESPASRNRIGPAAWNEVPPELRDLLFKKLSDGGISDPVETTNGIAIFQLYRRVADPARSSGQVKQLAKDQMIQAERKRLAAAAMENLRRKYAVENHWLDKDYEQWKDSDVVYRVGPTARTFQELKNFAVAEESIMAAGVSPLLMESFIEMDLQVLDFTKGTGRTDKCLSAREKGKVLARIGMMSLAREYKQTLGETMVSILAAGGLKGETAPKSLEEGAERAFRGLARALILASPGWYELEEIEVRPQPGKANEKGGIPTLWGIEAAKKVREALQKGADPKTAATLLPRDSLFEAVFKPARRVPDLALSEPTRRSLGSIKLKTWSQPIPREDGVSIYRTLQRKADRALSFSAARAEFVPAFEKHVVFQSRDKINKLLLGRVTILSNRI